MLEKAWVHLSRVDPAYEKGAWDFVQTVSAGDGCDKFIICLCTDCRNVDRHSTTDIVDHLVRRRMDEVYKQRKDWYHHGEVYSVAEGDMKEKQWNEEIVGLYRVVENLDEELATERDFCEMAEGEDMKEYEFLAKIEDAETPLYYKPQW